MILKPFELERYFAQYEFNTKHLLSSSDCDGLSLEYVLSLADRETKKLWDTLVLGYTESSGHPLMKTEIAKLYKNIKPNDVLTVVPQEGIFITINSLLKASDHIIVTFPGYQSLYDVARAIGCEITHWLPDESDGWRFNPEFLKENIKPSTRLIVFNFPHNPTGYYPSQQDFKDIIDIARQHNLYIFSDEMYRFLEYNRSDRLPSAVDLYNKAIVLFGMSKTFGMAGVRIGWIVTKDKAIYQKMAEFKDYVTICASAPSEILSIIALRAKNTIIEKNIEKIKKNLTLTEKFIRRHSDRFTWVKPKAGTVCFPRLINESASDLCQKLVKEAGVMLVPSTVFDYGDSHIRLGLGRENFPESLSIFEDYLGKL